MSYDSLKAIGKLPKGREGIGARPDVVQMTRDKYDSEGKLKSRGLVSGVEIGASPDVALVFDESVMDSPDYDNLGSYPNLPSLPFDHLKSVLVNDEEGRVKAQEVVDKNNLKASVITRGEWEAQKYAGQNES